MATNKNSSIRNPGEQEFVIERGFEAPRQLVWEAWTKPEALQHWWGPKGFTWVDCKIDLRPEGMFHYSMRSPDGHDMWGKLIYREIVPPERLAFVVSFSDKDGNTLRHLASPTWPLEVLNTMTLTEHEGRTTVTLQGVPINATEEECQTFKAGHKSLQQGIKGTLDQLADYLAKA